MSKEIEEHSPLLAAGVRSGDVGMEWPMLEYLTTQEVSAWIRVSSASLCRWRQTGQGPRVTWMAHACPRYKRSDVEKWLERMAA